MHTSSQNAVVLGNTYTWADAPGAGCTDLLTSGGKKKGRCAERTGARLTHLEHGGQLQSQTVA